MKEIILRDGMDIWVVPLRNLVGLFQSDNVAVLESGLDLFCILFSKMDNRINLVVP